MEQRLERYDAAFAAQCFDFLVHIIGRLQASCNNGRRGRPGPGPAERTG